MNQSYAASSTSRGRRASGTRAGRPIRRALMASRETAPSAGGTCPISVGPAENFETLTGKGVRGRVAGQAVAIGNRGFLTECGVDFGALAGRADAEREMGRSALLAAIDGAPAALLVIQDPMMIAAAAMSLSSVSVVGNPLRLRAVRIDVGAPEITQAGA